MASKAPDVSIPSAGSKFETAVKEALEVGAGQRGDTVLDRWVRVRDLVDDRLINWLNRQQNSVTNQNSEREEQEKAPAVLKRFTVSAGALYHLIAWEWPDDIGNIS